MDISFNISLFVYFCLLFVLHTLYVECMQMPQFLTLKTRIMTQAKIKRLEKSGVLMCWHSYDDITAMAFDPNTEREIADIAKRALVVARDTYKSIDHVSFLITTDPTGEFMAQMEVCIW